MHLEQDRHQNEMYMLQNEIKKWQDKHDGTVKELHLRESAIHRIELELDSSRTDLERAKLQADKMESSKQLQESHCTQLNREIDSWKEKYNKAQDEVSDPFSTKVMFGRELPQKNVEECLFRYNFFMKWRNVQLCM